MQRMFRQLLALAAILAVVVLCVGTMQYWEYSHRPLFYSTFHGDMGLSHWKLAPQPVVDAKGNWLLADIPLNALVLIKTADPRQRATAIPKMPPPHCSLSLDNGKRVSFEVRSNTLTIVDESGSIITKPLVIGEAKRVMERVSVDDDVANI